MTAETIFQPQGLKLSDGNTYRIGYEGTKGDYSEYKVFKAEEDGDNFVHCGDILSRTDEEGEVRIRVEIMVGITDYADVAEELEAFDPD